MKDKKKFDFKTYAVLHFILLLYSFVGVFMKKAFEQEFFSFWFLLFAGLAVLFLGIYALVWQQVLAHMSLTFAITNRPIRVIYSLIWSVLIFREKVTPLMVVGVFVILTGVIIGVSKDAESDT